MSVQVRDPRLRAVVGSEVSFEKIATGFLFTEGPLWHARERYLLFSDMPGDHLRKWSAKEGVTTFRKPCSQTNGLAWDAKGRLLACEHASSRLTRTEETIGDDPGAPDGMKVDVEGNLYCAGPGGIHVFAPDAACLGVIRVPEYTANFCWGDADSRSLYITASTSIYRIRTQIAGRPQML